MDREVSLGYLRKPTSQCVTYLKSFGMKISDADQSLSIPGLGGLVYKLSNGEIVLIPTDFELDYSGFIFSDLSAFEKMVKEEYFPVQENELTSWEIERQNLKKIPISVPIYEKSFKDALKIRIFDLQDDSQLEIALDGLYKLFRKRQITQVSKERILLAFSILIMDLLVKEYSGSWASETRYEIYNSYDYPLIKIGGRKRDIVNDMYILFDGEKPEISFFKKFIGLE